MAASTILDQPQGTTRRRFLQGAAAAAGASAILPSWLAKAAMAASSPLGPTDGMVVVVTLRGGNDALNTVVPISGTLRSLYDTLRGTLGITGLNLLPLNSEFGLNKNLPKLAARFKTGKVALVNGVGLPIPTLSHFDAMPNVMSGSSTFDLTSGWLGRYLDGVGNWESGVAGLNLANSPRLHLVGKRAKVPSLPGSVQLWTPTTAAADVAAQTCIRALGATSSGRGALSDLAARVNVEAFDRAAEVQPFYAGTFSATPIVRDLQLAARALNTNVGTRVVGVEMNGWDTHAQQDLLHPKLLGELDTAIETFWTTLAPAMRSRTTMVVLSEFGRRPKLNGSRGTDHGTSGVAAVIGDNVKGGVTGQLPSLTNLDADGNLKSTVDFRSVYASVLSKWMKADDRQVLGATFPQLDLFAAGPGAARPS